MMWARMNGSRFDDLELNFWSMKNSLYRYVLTSIMNRTTEPQDDVEAVAYIVVGWIFELGTSGSAFYLTAWENMDSEMVQGRLDRISSNSCGRLN